MTTEKVVILTAIVSGIGATATRQLSKDGLKVAICAGLGSFTKLFSDNMLPSLKLKAVLL